MILRLVFSFFFFSLVTGDQQGHYGYPAHGMIQKNKATIKPESEIETRRYEVDIVSDDDPSLQVRGPLQYVDKETEYSGKTICFTPSMVHTLIKAALEYVSNKPSDINYIIDKLDQELNRMSDPEIEIEENAVKPTYPLDSKRIFQLLGKPRSEGRTNLILKYELPTIKEPHCREALEKLIEIAYISYLELEKHPQCRDYLYKFSTHQPDDLPTGHLDQGPDLKSLITLILDQVDKRKPKKEISAPDDRFGDMPDSNGPTPKNNNPQEHGYNIPQQPQKTDYNVQPKNVPKYTLEQSYILPSPTTFINEYGIPQVVEETKPEYNIPNNHVHKVPQGPETIINEYNVPHVHEPTKPEFNVPNIHVHKVPQGPKTIINEYNVPHVHEPTKPEYIIPNIHVHKVPQGPEIIINEYNVPHVHEPTKPEFNAPNIHVHKDPHDPKTIINEYNVPHLHEGYNIPQQPQKTDYNVQPKNVPKYTLEQSYILPSPTTFINEYGIPQVVEETKPEFNAPNIHVHKVPQDPKTIINEYNVPHVHEPTKPENNIPNNHVHKVPQGPETIINEYNLPHVHEQTKPEFNIPNIHEYNVPKVQDTIINKYSVPNPYELNKPEFNIPKVQEYNINKYNVPKVPMPQNNENLLPKVHKHNVPNVHEYNIPETQDIEEIIPMQPEETINILIKLIKSGPHGPGILFDRLLKIIQENPNNFHPMIHKLLITLLNVHKQNNIPNFNDIFLLLLDAQTNRDWPWSARVTEQLLFYLIPNQNGYLDPRIIEIILNLYKKQPSEKLVEYILTLLRPIKEGKVTAKIVDIILRLILLNQHNLLRPDHMEILIKLLKPSQNGNVNPVDVDVADNLSRWNEMGMTPQQLDAIIEILKPNVLKGLPDHRPVDIIHFLLTKGKLLNPKHIDFILSFLYPNHGVLDGRRIDVMYFILNNLSRYPKASNTLLQLLLEYTPAVLKSRFLDILLYLNSNGLLTPELLETIINLLALEVNGKLQDPHVKTLFFLLAPFKQSNPKIIADVLSLLTQGGLYGNIVKWLEITNNNGGLPNRDPKPYLKPENEPQNYQNEYRTPDDGYQTEEPQQQVPVVPDQEFMAILKWLESQGLLTQDQGSNNDLVNKILNIIQVGQHELGVVELTYMLKHEKPLIYQPVYYVKYRLPILSFISNMKTLLLENPNLNADPTKLLQELIMSSNVTEVSPNLQGFPKEEILKLTFSDGDLVQAKILDEQNLSLNDQITVVHGLNADISPEEILQLNQINEAKYFPSLLQVKEVQPNKLTIKGIQKIIQVPPVQTVHYRQIELPDVKPLQTVHYRHIELPPVVSHITNYPTKTMHTKTYISRDNPRQDKTILLNNNAQLMS